ncbi:MAG: alpha/beta hydrolase [Promethearchaeota archaeon]
MFFISLLISSYVKYYSGFDTEEIIPKNYLFPHARPFWLKHDAKESKAVKNANTSKKANISKKRKKAIVICVHGHGATTYEIRPIADAIFEKGIDVASLLLPAHGIRDIKQAQKAMGKVKMEYWLDAVRSEITKAKEIHDYGHVFIYGQSMGGALSLVMAAEDRIDAGAVTAAAIKLPKIAAVLTFLLGWLNFNIRVNLEPQEIFNELYAFRNMPDTKQLQRLANYSLKHLEHIKCPLLVCHSHNDTSIDPIVPSLIQKNATGIVKINWYDKSGHCMPLDIQGQEIASDIGDFFLQQLSIRNDK